MKINEIHLGDCLELMWQIPDHSIDMVLCDLPYGTTACAWDSIIDLDLLWEHYKRVIKPGGAIVLTGSQPFTTALINAGGLDWFKYEWIWDKVRPSGMQIAKVRPMQRHENIVVFCKNSPIYNPVMVNRKVETTSWAVKSSDASPLKYNDGKKRKYTHFYPQSIQAIPKPNPMEYIHPTQKPVALFAYLINTYTNPGDLVLDNAAGSGTTAIAAIDTGRNWLLIEKDPEYYQVAKDRINKRLQQPFLPGTVTAHNKPFKPNYYQPGLPTSKASKDSNNQS